MTLPGIAPDERTIAMSDEPLIEFEPSTVDDTQKRLGRYELVYELGTGGMANVYLARLAGPAGFQKWFAIKRIHRHLAKDRRFVEMFLDEAHISSSLQHPNVAPVFDLGNEGGEYFIAMEYLHGEHLGSVGVRAAREMGRLAPALAAHAVARAADGLHHAHEAKDRDGTPLKLVHRDVSPQNIFVTYDGRVCITDFGIAKAANRITQTETGSTKGKLAYMSPEHALNHPLDRRADIFALGTVLWELTVGRRLFKGENDAATLMRITSGKAIHPSQVVSDYPPELERIVLRALAHDRTQRYPTAAAFARDLDRFVSNSGTPAGPPELSALMHQLFGDRIAAKDALLRADRVSETKASIALGVIDRREDDGSGSDAMPREQSHSSVVTRTPSPRALPTERRWPIVALGLIALAAIAGVAAMVLPNDPTGSLRVASTPSGARVRVGEEVVGTTPVTVEGLAIGRHPITLELPGYDPFSASVDVESGRTELNYRLVARVSGPTTTDPPPTPTPVVNEDSTVEEPVDEARVEDAPATITPTITPEPAPTPIDPPEPEPEDEEVEVEEPTPSVADRTPTVRRPPPPPAGPPAYLNLITSPWAEVRINGRDAGRTPLVRRSVPSGRIVIRMRAEGQGPWRTERVNAAPGETVSRRFDL